MKPKLTVIFKNISGWEMWYGYINGMNAVSALDYYHCWDKLHDWSTMT